MAEAVDWRDFRELKASRGDSTWNVLLGNGFSIACDQVFRYDSLYKQALKAGIPDVAEQLFEQLGTTDFEQVLRKITSDEVIEEQYHAHGKDIGDAEADRDQLREALISAIAQSHVPSPAEINGDWIECTQTFLSEFSSIFTTNYDLLLYWALMHGENPLNARDGFGRSDLDGDRLRYFGSFNDEDPSVLYLHGAVHLYAEEGKLFKREAGDSRLLDVIRPPIEAGEYPVFVTEGSPKEKYDHISRVPYLRRALKKFRSIEGELFVFGHSLGHSDAHISLAIAGNKALERLVVGTTSKPGTDRFERVEQRVQKILDKREELVEEGLSWPRGPGELEPLEVEYFEASTAGVWFYPLSFRDLEDLW